MKSAVSIWKYRKSTHDSMRPKDRLVTVKRQKGGYALCSVLSNNKDSVLNTSAITAITKSSMKSQSGATANRHLRSSGERNGEQRRTKVRLGRTMM